MVNHFIANTFSEHFSSIFSVAGGLTSDMAIDYAIDSHISDVSLSEEVILSPLLNMDTEELLSVMAMLFMLVIQC